MTVSLKTTLESFKDALTTNAGLAAWAKANYGRHAKIFINYDIRNPPGVDDCPYIMLRPIAARYGRAATEKTIEFDMICCLYNDSSVQDPETNAVEYTGVQHSLDMLDFAVAAIVGVSTGNSLMHDITAEFETIEWFPFFMAGCPLILVEPLPIAADRTSL